MHVHYTPMCCSGAVSSLFSYRQSPRERPVYISITNEIEVRIVMSTKANDKEKVHFLLHYQGKTV